MPPRLVIFDMDDVLCHYDLGRRLRALSRLTGKTPRDIRAAIWDSGFEDDSDAGGYPNPAEYLAEFGRRIGHKLSCAEWIAARRQSMTPDAEVLDLARVIGRGARLVIYSNNGPLVKLHFKELFPEAAAIISECYCSYEFATRKPDPASFTRLLARVGVAPAESWFIDDKRSNVQGAAMAGLAGHHFRSYRALFAAARSLGFVP
ncbi:MAG: HAD family hydrolase [Hyphomicrobiales bacterium]